MEIKKARLQRILQEETQNVLQECIQNATHHEKRHHEQQVYLNRLVKEEAYNMLAEQNQAYKLNERDNRGPISWLKSHPLLTLSKTLHDNRGPISWLKNQENTIKRWEDDPTIKQFQEPPSFGPFEDPPYSLPGREIAFPGGMDDLDPLDWPRLPPYDPEATPGGPPGGLPGWFPGGPRAEFCWENPEDPSCKADAAAAEQKQQYCEENPNSFECRPLPGWDPPPFDPSPRPGRDPPFAATPYPDIRMYEALNKNKRNF
jgi:hypothetical protein